MSESAAVSNPVSATPDAGLAASLRSTADPAPPSAAKDRRRTMRDAQEERTRVRLRGGEREWSGELLDVAWRGAGVKLDGGAAAGPPDEGSLVDLEFTDGPKPARITGRVVWGRAEKGVARLGIEFAEDAVRPDRILLDMDEVRVNPSIALRLPANLALRRHLIPFAEKDGAVHVACLNERDQNGLQAVARHLKMTVLPEPAEPDSLRRALQKVYGDGTGTPTIETRVADAGDVMGVCDEILQAAVLRQASDIHVDPTESQLNVRFRVDGVLENYRSWPATMRGELISRFKVLSDMDIAEKRAAQDGGFKHKFGPGGRFSVDIRSATLPTQFGEKMTLRLLALETESLTLERLGMSEADLKAFERAIHMPHGLILLTGPTGSGKSTTLYASIRRLLASRALNVITIEHPIEYQISGVTQVEVDTADKVTFAKALRSVLRHDPDVVMIGEIRDFETADTAMKAALTGHLVFSTLHTNSAASALTRLVDMGIERYLVAATMRLSVAQRLVRRLCRKCRRARGLTLAEAQTVGRATAADQIVFDAGGCIYCAGRGFMGRLGLFELLPVGPEVSREIAGGATEERLRELMRAAGVPDLMSDAADKLLAGQSSFAEIAAAVAV